MPRVKKPAKVKEPIRLRMKEVANGNKSLYLDIYRDGKRTYEYLKMYLIPETDNNAHVRNQTTLLPAAAEHPLQITRVPLQQSAGLGAVGAQGHPQNTVGALADLHGDAAQMLRGKLDAHH